MAARRDRGYALVSVKVYVEGGGTSKEQQIRCRAGFSKLIEKAGFVGRMPAIFPSGGRDTTYRDFGISLRNGDDSYSILLVDSEDPVTDADESPDSPAAWNHLSSRDGWSKPTGVANDQAQLMVTCMETWILADRRSLRSFFGAKIRPSALLPEHDPELRSREDVQRALENATRGCGRNKMYRKGSKSFQLLAELNPDALKERLPHFRRFLATLDRHLRQPE
jgi:hypothetical protein